MDQIKIDNYIKENPSNSFPSFCTLEEQKCVDIRSLLYENMGLNPSSDTLNLVKEVDRLGEVSEGINCCDESFDLKGVLLSLGVNSTDYVYINWYRFDDIDKIVSSDLVNNFDDIWYPDVDDIDIFDESLSWLLSVSHYGQLKTLMIKKPVAE